MTLDDMPLQAVLAETADAYETAASLPAVVERGGGKVPSKPGSRMPPGMSEVIDADEHQRALTGVDEWALYVAHHLLDVEPGIGSVPDSTPGRLRLASRWADRLSGDPDIMARYAFESEAREHLVTMRRLARRGTRRVRTGSACMDVACAGQFVATIDGPEVDGYIVCDRCGMRVEKGVWERWGSRSEWVTAEHVASHHRVTVQLVWQWAKRYGWRRQGRGRRTRYHREDAGVSGERGRLVG